MFYRFFIWNIFIYFYCNFIEVPNDYLVLNTTRIKYYGSQGWIIFGFSRSLGITCKVYHLRMIDDDFFVAIYWNYILMNFN